MFRISNIALAIALAGLSSTQAFAPSSAFGVQRYSSFQNDVVAKESFVAADAQTRLFMASDVSESAPTKLVRKPDSNVEITLTASGKSTKAAYDAACAEMSKSLSIPGFRKGAKIPAPVIENAVAAKGGRNTLRTQAVQTLLNQMLEPALKDEHNLEPIGQPTLVTPADELAERFKPGEPIEIVVACDVWPDIKWKTVEGKEKPYIGLTGKYTRKPFNQARLDQALKDLAERYATTEPAPEGKVLEMGDACIVDMVGYMAADDGVSKGEPLPAAASGDNVEVVLGPGRYMEGLVEGLVGAKVGETKTVYVSFPAGLRDKSLAGKKAVFDVTVKESNIRSVPEINDELAEKIRPGLDAEGLIQELRKAVDEQDIAEWTQPRNKALAKALAEVMDVEVPDTLVTNQAREKYAQMMAEFRTGGMADEEIKKQITPENFLKYKNIEKADIIADFKTSMAVDEIARIENIQVPEYQIDEQMEALKKEAAGEDLGDEGVLRTKIESTISRRLVFDFLAENSNLTVEYSDEPVIDEALLEQLAQDTLKREEEMAAKVASNQELSTSDSTAKKQAEEEANAAKAAAEAKKQAEEEADAAKAAAEAKKKAEEEAAAAKAAAEAKKKAEEEAAAAKATAEAKKQAEEEAAAKAAAEAKKKAEEEAAAAKAAAEAKKKAEEEEAAAKAAAEAKKKAEEEAAAKAAVEAKKKAEEEAAAAAKAAAEAKKKAEEEAAAKAAAEAKKKAEEEAAAAKAAAEAKKKAEEEAAAKAAAEAKKKAAKVAELSQRALLAARLNREKAHRDAIMAKFRARQQPKSPEEAKALKEKYGAIEDLGERAFQILVDLGMVDITPEV